MFATQNKKGKALFYPLVMLLVLVLCLSGCQAKKGAKKQVNPSSLSVKTSQEKEVAYDKLVTAVIKEIDLERNTITVFDIEKETDRFFSYSSSTEIKDRHEKQLTMSQMEIGQIVDVYYKKKSSKNEIVLMSINQNAWDYSNVDRYVMEKTNSILQLGNRNYQYDENLIISSGTELIGSIDLNQKDQLHVRGIGNKVYSIAVTKGHGYIRLKNYKDFIGGMIEVGYGTIVPIVDNMLLVVREGTYNVRLEHEELVAEKKITLLRDEEITLDMSEYHKKVPKVGFVTFQIDPKEADLYINGALRAYDDPVKLNYGKYDVKVSLTGYEDYEGILTVGSDSSTIIISLAEGSATVKEDSDTSKDNPSDDEKKSNNTNNSNSTNNNANTNNSSDDSKGNNPKEDTENKTSVKDNVSSNSNSEQGAKKVDSKHKITVESPKGAEVYLNGTLKGTAPVSFQKEIGTHTVTLSQDGYTTKSYTVEIEDDEENVELNFPAMTKLQ